MKRISSNLFLAFVFLLPFQTVYLLREPVVGGEKWQYGTIGIYASVAVLALAVISAAFSSLRALTTGPLTHRMAGLWTDHKSDVFLALLVLWAGLSVSWASDRTLAVYGFLTLILAAGAFVMARGMVRSWGGQAILHVLVLGALAQSVIGIGQFLSQETFSSTFLGTAAHPAWQAGTSVLKNESGRWLRSYGTFPHPNSYGLFVAVGLFLVVSWIVEKRTWITASESRIRTLYIAAIPILSLGLILSFSRLAWGGFALGLLLLAAQRYRHVRKSKVRTWRYPLAFVATMIVSGAIFASILHDVVLPRFDGSIVSQEGSVSDRLTTYRDAFRVIQEHLFFGSGMWNSTAELIRLDADRPVWDIQPAHDVPLLVLAELGPVGLILSFLFVATFGISVFSKQGIPMLAGVLLVSLPSLLLDHFLWDSPFGLFLFFVLLGSFSARTSVVKC